MRTAMGVMVVAAVLSAAAAGEVDEGLVAHYTFGRAKGRMIRDASGTGNGGTIHNGTRVRTAAGRGIRFQKKRDAYIEVGRTTDLDLAGDMSFAAWVKLEADPYPDDGTNWTLLDCETNKKNGFILRVDGNSAKVLYRSSQAGGSDQRHATKKLQNKAFYHVAFTREGKNVAVFINGRRQFVSEIARPAPPTQPLRISTESQSFTGVMDDVRLYNRALRRDEVLSLAEDRKGRLMDKDAMRVAAPPVVLEGDRLKLGFSSADYHVTSFEGRGKFGDIAARIQTDDNALWRILLMSDRGRPAEPPAGKSKKTAWQTSIEGLGKKVTVDAKAECEKSHQIEKTAGGVRMRMFWKGMDVGDEKGVLDVTATVRIPNGSNLAFWTLEMKNRSKVYGIWEYFYPVIEIAPPDADLEKNFFLNTFRMGEVMPDPFHVKPDADGKTLYDHTRRLYVGHNTKTGQFTALYGANGRGFFYSSRDGEGWQKRLDVSFYPQQPSTRLEMWHAPLNLGYAGEDFTMPFEMAAGFFSGDWYDACQLYREWALKQIWCRKGPVVQRKDIPQWLKDCSLVLRQDTKADASRHGGLPILENRRHQTVANNRRNFLRCLDLYGGNTASVWYTWWIKDKSKSAAPVRFLQNTGNGNDGQLVSPIPGVVETNRQVVAAGGYPLAYINGVIYDMGDAEDFERAKHAAQRNILGDLYVSKGDPQACSMCRYATWWRDRYAELCRRAIKEFGFKGVYWDSYGKDGYRCFATEHGHSYGGGTKWIQGEREFGEYVRRVMKEADPEAVNSAEASTEEFIDLVDTRLCAVILRDHVAPIFSAVYHDYQLFFGRRMVPGTPEPEFSMTAAYSFNLGGQFGRYFIHGKGLDADAPAHAEKGAFLKALIKAKSSAKEFLNFGKMMRPPKMLSDVPTLTATVWYHKQSITLPAVLCSAWRAANGDIGLVFVNCSYEPMKFTYQVDTVEYGFPEGTSVRRHLRWPPRTVDVEPIVSGIHEEEDGLPAHGIKIVVLEGKR